MPFDEARAPDAPSDAPELAYLNRLRAAVTRDITRYEEALSGDGEGRPRLYERLLRVRRISDKLENRIQVDRLQRTMRAG